MTWLGHNIEEYPKECPQFTEAHETVREFCEDLEWT